MGAVELNLEPKSEELFRSFLTSPLRMILWCAELVVVVLGWVVLIYPGVAKVMGWDHPVQALYGTWIFVLLPLWGVAWWHVNWRKRRPAVTYGPGCYRISDEGISWSLPTFLTHSAWTNVRRVQETSDDFLVIVFEGKNYLFPKRCLNEAGITAFRALVRKHVLGAVELYG